MNKFKDNESVVAKRVDGSTHSGKVVNQIEDRPGFYLIAYINNGISLGVFHESRITSFNGAAFMVTE